jgi:hypothetical protein
MSVETSILLANRSHLQGTTGKLLQRLFEEPIPHGEVYTGRTGALETT